MDLVGVIERIDLGVVIQDAATRILFVNREARELLGVDEAQLLESNSLDRRWDVVHPDGTPFDLEQLPVPTAIRERREVRGVLMGVFRQRYEDRVWIMVNALPQLNADGSVREVVCTFSNISHEHAGQRELQALNVALAHAVEARTVELSRAMEALKQSESSYRAVIRAMAEGVAVHAPDGSIESANPAAEQILGLTLAQLQNRHPVDPAWQLTHADGKPLTPDDIPSEITRKTGIPCRNVLLRVQRANGERAWLSVNTDPIRARIDNEPVGVVATFTDITVERNALLSLRDAQRQEAMGVLAGGIAHNFNNMLTVILPSLERLRSEVPVALMSEAEDAYNAALQAADLVKQLLLLARKEPSARVEPVELGELCRDVVLMCRKTFDRRIAFELVLPDAPVSVFARRSELQQAMLNLCINARDAIVQVVHPRIEVTLSTDGAIASISVNDNGTGMDERTLQRVGEPFFTTKAPGRGTGLGTASVLGIARDLGGALTWTSALGQGSCFVISLPLARAPEA